NGWRPGPRARYGGYIVFAVRQARSISGGIRKASRRIDRTKRALLAPDLKAKEALSSAAEPSVRKKRTGAASLGASQTRSVSFAEAKPHSRRVGPQYSGHLLCIYK